MERWEDVIDPAFLNLGHVPDIGGTINVVEQVVCPGLLRLLYSMS